MKNYTSRRGAEADRIATEALRTFRANHGTEAAADLVRLVGADAFGAEGAEAVRRIMDSAKAEAERRAKEAETANENYEHCRGIAFDLDLVADGKMYKCPHCGDHYNIDEAEETEDGHLCPNCSEEVEEDEAEAIGFYDWLDDIYNIDYTIGSDGDYKSCRLMIACGGPNIYIDTADAAVQLYWWSDRATAYFNRDTAEAIDEVFEEYYNCTR